MNELQWRHSCPAPRKNTKIESMQFVNEIVYNLNNLIHKLSGIYKLSEYLFSRKRVVELAKCIKWLHFVR